MNPRTATLDALLAVRFGQLPPERRAKFLKMLPSHELRAAADESLKAELEASTFQPLPCDEVIK